MTDKNEAREHISAERFLAIEGFADSRAHSSTAIAALMERYAVALTQERDALRGRLKELDNAFLDGVESVSHKKTLEQNPYRHDTEGVQWEHWRAGYKYGSSK